MQNLPKFNKNILWILAVVIATVFGTLIGVTYPTWYGSLPFRDSIPKFLRPPSTFFETVETESGIKVIRTVEESAVIDAVNKASPGVVSIVASSVSFDPVEGVKRDQQGIGTGFIIRSDGVILTASHVVENKSIKYKVVTNDQKTFDVKKISMDPSIDFAILQIDATDLPTVNLGDSSSIQAGQKVIAYI